VYYTNAVRFTWDPRKAASNARKHSVTFAEAVSVFADPLARIVEDAIHVDRSLIIGESASRRILVTVYVERSEHEIRIVSARRATPAERRIYETGEEEA
jgi:uncharacterized DUF497 family protein